MLLTIPHMHTHTYTQTQTHISPVPAQTHTRLTLKATLSGRPVLAAVVALHSTTEFTTTSQNRATWW